MEQKPTLGRIVHYRLSDHDAQLIRERRGLAALRPSYDQNAVSAGQTYPAMVVAAWGGESVNLQVYLDGVDSHWATSRSRGEAPVNEDGTQAEASGGNIPPGTWCWPPRA